MRDAPCRLVEETAAGERATIQASSSATASRSPRASPISCPDSVLTTPGAVGQVCYLGPPRESAPPSLRVVSPPRRPSASWRARRPGASTTRACPRGSHRPRCPVGTVGVLLDQFRGTKSRFAQPGDDKWPADERHRAARPDARLGRDALGNADQAGTLHVLDRAEASRHDTGAAAGTTPRSTSRSRSPGSPARAATPEARSSGLGIGLRPGPWVAVLAPPDVPVSRTRNVVDRFGHASAWPDLGAADGVISGMPAASGTYAFTVQALIADGHSEHEKPDASTYAIASRSHAPGILRRAPFGRRSGSRSREGCPRRAASARISGRSKETSRKVSLLATTARSPAPPEKPGRIASPWLSPIRRAGEPGMRRGWSWRRDLRSRVGC